MRCEEFESALQQQLDGQPAFCGDAAMHAHARQCSACRVLEVGFRLVAQGFVASRPPLPSPELTHRILDSLDRTHAPRRGWLKPAIGLAAAASLLVALAWRFLPPRSDESGIQSVAAVESRTRVADSPITARHAAASHEPLFPENDSRDETVFADAVEPVSEIVRAVGRSLGSPVRPIAIGATEVLGNFFKDLPDADSTMMPLPGMREMMPTPKKRPRDPQPQS